MAIPPSILISAQDAVQWVHARFNCSGVEALRIIQDWVDGRLLPLEWEGEAPEIAPRAAELDWFAGTYVQPEGPPLPRYDPDYLDGRPQEYGHMRGRVWLFDLLRAKLERAAAVAVGALPTDQEPAPVLDATAPLLDADHQPAADHRAANGDKKSRGRGRPSERDKIAIAVEYSLIFGSMKDKIPKTWAGVHQAICDDAHIKDEAGWGHDIVVGIDGVAREPVERARRERAEKP